MTLMGLRDSLAGERLAILATGPSLRSLRRDQLRGQVVLGINRYHEMIDGFADSDFYLCPSSNILRWARPGNMARTFTTPKFAAHFGALPVVNLGAEMEFSLDISIGAFFCHAAYVALQIGVWLGPKEIRLYGLDLTGPTNDRPGCQIPEATVQQESEAMGYASAVLRELPVKVINCSPNHLRCFPRS